MLHFRSLSMFAYMDISVQMCLLITSSVYLLTLFSLLTWEQVLSLWSLPSLLRIYYYPPIYLLRLIRTVKRHVISKAEISRNLCDLKISFPFIRKPRNSNSFNDNHWMIISQIFNNI